MKPSWNRSLALPPQLEWKYANEPELMSWTIKARNYNTFIANIMFAICSTIGFMLSLFFYLGFTNASHDNTWGGG